MRHFHHSLHLSTTDVETYYFHILDVMFPYVQNRPVKISPLYEFVSTLNKNGIETFQKTDELTLQQKAFAICATTDSLKTLIGMGVHELLCWHSTIQHPLYPNWCIFSVAGDDFREVADAALELNRFLREFEVHAYPRITSNGLDIYIPLDSKFQYEQARQFGELVTTLLTEEWDQQRKESVEVSYALNSPLCTAPAPYSLVFADSVYISAPLEWYELKDASEAPHFSLEESLNRIGSKGDCFKPVLNKGVELNKILKGLSHLLPF